MSKRLIKKEMADNSPRYLEQAEDILGCWLDWRKHSKVALAIVSDTLGGAVRAPGALMAIREDGAFAGYMSGGCIDADIIHNAIQALSSNMPLSLRYGQGSRFTDLPLPCGGAINVDILPDPNHEAINSCYQSLMDRKPSYLGLTRDFELVASRVPKNLIRIFRYTPKVRLRIAGRGADCLALARIAEASGIAVRLQLTKEADWELAEKSGFRHVDKLTSPRDLPDANDDGWTAFVLAFHDADWELPLFEQALLGSAFYLGAVGSSKTHTRRCEVLSAAGFASSAISRIRGPIGLVPSLRNASQLAISTLAEIIAEHAEMQRHPFRNTVHILLAGGQSSRFEGGDKLLAPLSDKPIISHSAHALDGETTAGRIAIVAPGQDERQKLLKEAGWSVVVSPLAEHGMGGSIRAGVTEALELANVDRILLQLADMPRINKLHFRDMCDALTPAFDAVISRSGDLLLPPAIFSREAAKALLSIEGDAGGKQVFAALPRKGMIDIPADEAVDIDTAQDLANALEVQHAF